VTTASRDTLLGRSASPGWAILQLSNINIHHAYDQDLFSHADPYALVTLSPGGVRYYSKVLQDQNSGDLAMNIYVPLTAALASVEIHDEDHLLDDKIGSFVVQLPGSANPACNTGSSGSCSFTRDVTTQERNWWWRLVDVSAGSASGRLMTGSAMRSYAVALNAAGTEMVDAWTPILEPNSAGSWWARVEYSIDQGM
jgi:hypothetical protein